MTSSNNYLIVVSRNPRSRKMYSARGNSKAKHQISIQTESSNPKSRCGRSCALLPQLARDEMGESGPFARRVQREEAEQHDGMMACRVKSRCDANPSYACTHPFESLSPYQICPLTRPPRECERAPRPVLPPGCFLTFLTCSTKQASNGEGGSRRNSQARS